MIWTELPSALVLHPEIPLPESVRVTAIFLFVAVFILDLFDISLPRGDSIGVSGALCAAALLILGPFKAIPICLLSLVLAFVLRPGGRPSRWMVTGLSTRAISLGLGTLAMGLLGVEGAIWHRYVVVFVVPAVLLFGELVVAQVGMALMSKRPLARLIRGNLVVQAPLLIAEWSAAVLLFITFEGMGSWSLVPVVALLLLIRQSYALLLDIRETYRTTVEVLVEAAEGQDSRLSGHGERTAVIARKIAMRVGLTVPQVELVSYAALLHDVDAIRGDARVADQDSAGHSSELFDGVDFFADVRPILRVCDGDFSSEVMPSDGDLVGGFIVALASDADSAESADVAAMHNGSLVARVSPGVSGSVKAAVVAAALSLGYKIPAVS